MDFDHGTLGSDPLVAYCRLGLSTDILVLTEHWEDEDRRIVWSVALYSEVTNQLAGNRDHLNLGDAQRDFATRLGGLVL